MRLNIAVPEEHVKKPVLDAALESVTRLNESLIKGGTIPHFRTALNRVRWRPEPFGSEHFDHAATVLSRGWGDCDDLAPWHAASLRASGQDPGAKAIVKRSGPKLWHAVVQRSNGTIDDPSREAGMRSRTASRAATIPHLPSQGVSGDEGLFPTLAMRPKFDGSGAIVGWDGRADIPWHHSPADWGDTPAMVALHSAPLASQAIVGALRGAVRTNDLIELADQQTLDLADGIADAFEGADWSELAGLYGEEAADGIAEVVGAFWDDIADVASKAVQFIPGVGPIASTAIDVTHDIVKEATKDRPKKKAKRKRPRAVAAAEKKRAKRIVFPRARMTPEGIFYTFE